MQEFGKIYPSASYGEGFTAWLSSGTPVPYNSCGNSSAMRMSPAEMYSGSFDKTLSLAKISAEFTHNHPEGLKDTQAIAASVFIAKHRRYVWDKDTKGIIRHLISSKFGYNEVTAGNLVANADIAFYESLYVPSVDFINSLLNLYSIKC